ncbi:MAG: sporulation protein YunB [Moorellaceae bacterium]
MRRRWRRPGQRGEKIVIWLLLSGFCLLLLAEWRLKPALEKLAVVQAQWVATEAIQKAVLEQVAGEIKYQDLVQPASDHTRQVLFMQADVWRISQLQAQAQLAIQERLAELKGRTYFLPLGQILGLRLLAAYGPPIPLSFVPLGTVAVTLGDTFEAAGINQTRHRIYLQVESDVQVVAPLVAEKVKVESQIPVAEAIIVGPVPEMYLSLGTEPSKGILRSPSF